MSPDPSPDSPFPRRESRRHFLKKAGALTAAVAGADLLQFPLAAATAGTSLPIVVSPGCSFGEEAPVQWAIGELRDALAARGVNATLVADLDQVRDASECIFIIDGHSALLKQPLDTPESFALERTQYDQHHPVLIAAGADARGLVYALLELADRVNLSSDPLHELKSLKSVTERPANAIRSISRLFASDVEDKPWYNDRAFWQRYLTTLATNRFNRFNLGLGLGYDFTTGITDCYFHFAYPFLLSVPGYDVRANPLPDAERDNNLAMLKFISDEAAKRGLQFQLGLWTHAYKWTNSPKANYIIEGLTPETQGPYSRDAVKLLLTHCPNITGVTIRTHGESGVAEGNTDIWKTIFSGVADCGRKVEIDLHAKGMDPAIIEAALATGLPVNISPKYWAEHMGLPYMQGAIRQEEMPHKTREGEFFSRSNGMRSFLRYGYGDLFTENRRHGVLHRIWPGTQRVLLWGDPEIAAAYGRVTSFCGGNGVEILEPMTFKGRKGSGLPGGRNAYADESLKPAFDFEKYEYTYRVWGRNLYNPDTDPDGWQRLLRHQFARAAEPAEAALSAAGKILPLVTTAFCPSAANNNYWPEMYWNMPMTEAPHKFPYSDTPSPKRFGTVSSLDPEFFLSCDDFADELLGTEPTGKHSPVWVAARLEEYAAQTLAALKKLKVRDANGADFRRLKIDATLQAGLGNFYAAKFRAGVYHSLYLRTNDPEILRESLRENRAARATWADLANTAKGVYRDDVTYGPEYFQHGHWQDRLAAMDEDLADQEKLLGEPPSGIVAKMDWSRIKAAIQRAGTGQLSWKASEHAHPPLDGLHTPPTTFKRGAAVAIAVQAPSSGPFANASSIQLRYRLVNQAEVWQEVAMEKTAAAFHAMIPAAYTDSDYPLQYHFRIRSSSGAMLRPGLEQRYQGQPYFVIRQV